MAGFMSFFLSVLLGVPYFLEVTFQKLDANIPGNWNQKSKLRIVTLLG